MTRDIPYVFKGFQTLPGSESDHRSVLLVIPLLSFFLYLSLVNIHLSRTGIHYDVFLQFSDRKRHRNVNIEKVVVL